MKSIKLALFSLLFAHTLSHATPIAPDFPDNAFAAQLRYQPTPPPKITQKVDKIVAYFNEDGDLVEKPVPRGYYRVHLGNAANGRVVVQDFYSDTKTKQTGIFSVPKADLKNIQTPKVFEKIHFLYQPNGNLAAIHKSHENAVYKYNKLLLSVKREKNQSWAFDDKSTLMLHHINKKNQLIAYYYNDGRLFATRIFTINHKDFSQSKSVTTFFHDNGQKMMVHNPDTDMVQIWDDKGRSLLNASKEEKKQFWSSFLVPKIGLMWLIEAQFKHKNTVEYPENESSK